MARKVCGDEAGIWNDVVVKKQNDRSSCPPDTMIACRGWTRILLGQRSHRERQSQVRQQFRGLRVSTILNDDDFEGLIKSLRRETREHALQRSGAGVCGNDHTDLRSWS